MTRHFTLSELTHSAVAAARGIDNNPSPEINARLATLINKLLNPIREMWGAPINVNSGFRCPELNKAVGGAANSQHMRGEAADITAGPPGKNRQLFDMIVAAQKRGEIAFDQLIDEKDYTWLHISHSTGSRNQILHLK
jgi:hypothetical protein